MKFPTVFVNHGGGPLPLLGRQPDLTQHMKDLVTTWLTPPHVTATAAATATATTTKEASPTTTPTSIVVISAHWESDPVRITSSSHPSMLYDYYGFPPETYEYKYPAPGNPELARKMQQLLQKADIECVLDPERGFDHGVFVPLMIMFPEANIPVVVISLHASLSAEIHLRIGTALESLREDGVLLLGSGYTFHNMHHFFHPSPASFQASQEFNDWLKRTLVPNKEDSSSCTPMQNTSMQGLKQALQDWEKAPGARECHPREEHLLPLLVVAAAGGPRASPSIIYDVTAGMGDHAMSGYMFT